MATKVFVTGAAGFIGTAIVSELIQAGHKVLGLTRSESGRRALEQAGAEAIAGDINDAAVLRRGAEGADAVIHTAFDHDFSRFKQNCEADRKVIRDLGGILAGSNRSLVVTSGTSVASVGQDETATEKNPAKPSSVSPRSASEEAAATACEQDVAVSIVRNPQVHDTVKQGLVSFAIDIAKKTGTSAYVGDGANRWSAVPLADTARLYRLAMEKAVAGSVYHAVAEEGVPLRAIAEAIGSGLQLPVIAVGPEEVEAHFTWFAPFVGRSNVASGVLTQEQLEWRPSGPSLLDDLRSMFRR